jgi:hypothetical protein
MVAVIRSKVNNVIRDIVGKDSTWSYKPSGAMLSEAKQNLPRCMLDGIVTIYNISDETMDRMRHVLLPLVALEQSYPLIPDAIQIIMVGRNSSG